MFSPRRNFAPFSGAAMFTTGVCDVAPTGTLAFSPVTPVENQPLLASLMIWGLPTPQKSLFVYAAMTSPLESGRSPFASGKVGWSSFGFPGGPQVKKSETNLAFVVCTVADEP